MVGVKWLVYRVTKRWWQFVFSPDIIPSDWMDSKHQLTKIVFVSSIQCTLTSLLRWQQQRFDVDGRDVERFWCELFYSFDHLYMSQVVSVFLLPSSINLEQASWFYPSRIPCQFLQIFPENLSLFENLFFSPPALRCWCVSSCVYVCLCACVGAHVCCLCIRIFDVQIYKCVRDLWALRAMHVR